MNISVLEQVSEIAFIPNSSCVTLTSSSGGEVIFCKIPDSAKKPNKWTWWVVVGTKREQMKKSVIKVNHCDLADCRALQPRTQKCSEELEMKKSCETAALPQFLLQQKFLLVRWKTEKVAHSRQVQQHTCSDVWAYIWKKDCWGLWRVGGGGGVP